MLITDANGGVRFTVRVIPRSSRNEVEGLHGEAVKVKLRAPPVDGAANEALIALLADVLGTAKRDVTIVAGHNSRTKTIHVAGLSADVVKRLLVPGSEQ